MTTKTLSIDSHIGYVTKLVRRGGPLPDEWEDYQKWLDKIVCSIKDHQYKISDIYFLYEAFGEALSLETMQGFCFRKPHGYAGDFEVIDRMYRYEVTKKKELQNWDCFFHDRAAAKAVRNRKEYFKELLDRKVEEADGVLRVLNIASGPSRDLYEYLGANRSAPIEVHCVDMDEKAIAHSVHLLKGHLEQIEYHHKNIFRFDTDKKFDLIWSAGLFDYFNDKVFVRILERMRSWLAPGGEIVVGNFSESNPSHNYMDLVDWILTHRSEEQLIGLAKKAGLVDATQLWVGSEMEGVNLFLHVDYR